MKREEMGEETQNRKEKTEERLHHDVQIRNGED
jgi:hypothetical protein